MPTYEYKCDACGHAFEQFHSMMAAPIRKCPECKKLKVKRLIGTGAGLIFKGSGFYITDYRDQSYADKAKADAGGDAAKTDAAPAATGDGTGGADKAITPPDGKKPDAAATAKGDGKSPSAAPAPATPPAASKPAEPKSASRSASKKGR